jgi:hypothetical protein
VSAARCSACRRPVLWARVDGTLVALDAKPHEPVVGLVAFNPRRATGQELLEEHLTEAWRWAYAGATFHARHAETCARAEHHAGQDALAL